MFFPMGNFYYLKKKSKQTNSCDFFLDSQVFERTTWAIPTALIPGHPRKSVDFSSQHLGLVGLMAGFHYAFTVGGRNPKANHRLDGAKTL